MLACLHACTHGHLITINRIHWPVFDCTDTHTHSRLTHRQLQTVIVAHTVRSVRCALHYTRSWIRFYARGHTRAS